jgi:hypothetical protein
VPIEELARRYAIDRNTVRRAPTFNCQTGRSAAKFRKWVPIGFDMPVVL